MTLANTEVFQFHYQKGRRGRRVLADGKQKAVQVPPAGRVPRVARLMALAIRFDQLIDDGIVKDYAELARLGRVTRARISQIMSLLALAPDIQDDLLNLPAVLRGRDPISERDLRPVAAEPDWGRQKLLVEALHEQLNGTT